MAKKKQKTSDSELTGINFESSLLEVEQIVEQLESGELGLSESLGQYEKGIEKIKQCHQVLQRAEQKILLLTQVDEDGTAHTQDVEPAETAAELSTQDRDKASAKQPASRARRKKRDPDNVDDSGGLF
ncbi:exodeoxyribonuclease VII small subunit [Stieleria sp. JC731]|uniref:exodeoxyribonuclease VII small subunit n=1 Tax=Pirellulaceae TaxID=2691357 RepID=UPI001E61B17A|nr:exodeoxyribonuclease VII small subunit [Stieleria sp. JC731]MCC9600471.1 exodeoxyribonuclease VII small subunit [Stieleria sp. JC731]